MADGRPPAPQSPPVEPPGITCSTPCINCRTRCASNTTKPSTIITLVTSKPEFVGKPNEDAEAHHLRMNDCMDTHLFQNSETTDSYITCIR